MDQKARKTIAATLRAAAAKLQAADVKFLERSYWGDGPDMDGWHEEVVSLHRALTSKGFEYDSELESRGHGQLPQWVHQGLQVRVTLSPGYRGDKAEYYLTLRPFSATKKSEVYRQGMAMKPSSLKNAVRNLLRGLPAQEVGAAAKLQAADDEFPALNPKNAMVYFDLHFEDYNLEEDQGPNADEDMQERANDFLALGKGDITDAALKAEDMAVKEIGAMLKKAGLNVRLGDEGHGSGGELVMKFGVDSLDDVKKLVTFINKNAGGGDDVIYLNAPYMEARGFTLFPDGANNDKLMMGGSGDSDLEEWLEAQGG